MIVKREEEIQTTVQAIDSLKVTNVCLAMEDAKIEGEHAQDEDVEADPEPEVVSH